MDKLSVIIPARSEAYLEKTIQSILDAAKGDIEVIAVLDGWLPDPQINMNDDSVKFIHCPESIGQRAAINEGVRQSTGKHILKLDAHCSVDQGFDVKLIADCEYDWTVIPRMYNLDIDKWEPKLHKRTDYMYISSPTSEKPFRAQYYEGKAKDEGQRQPKNDKMIDDTMCCMGPCWFMHKDRFWELGGCDEGHEGGWGQQGIEVSMKAWLSGGSLKVNKNTWFAHWFRGGGGPGFPYQISGRQVERVRKYSQDLWLNDKWPIAKRKFQWVIDKFNPPGWHKMVDTGYPYITFPYKENEVTLDLGSGTRPRRQGITNIDIRELPEVDRIMDLRKLDYPDESVDRIISSDALEHFGRWEIQPLLEEWKRVLKPGGEVFISTVDFGRTVETMKDVPESKWLDGVYGGQKHEQDFHKMGFTKESFIKNMKDAGFQTQSIKRFILHRNPRMTIRAIK